MAKDTTHSAAADTGPDMLQVIGDLWTQGVGALDWQRIGVAVGIIAAAIVLRGGLAWALLRPLARYPAIRASLRRPARLLLPLIGMLVVQQGVLRNPYLRDIVADMARSLVVFIIFWAFYQVAAPLLARLSRRWPGFSDEMLGLATAGARVVIVGLGASSILEVWGVHVGAILAGFGLMGAAVALGAQDLFKNLIGGLFIIAERRFGIGDWIAAEGVAEGVVEVIGLRTTRLRQFDSSPIYVPNSQLSDNPVVNYQKMLYRRINWEVGVPYNSTTQQMQQLRDAVQEYLQNSPDFVQPPEAPIHVRINQLADSSINLLVYCFIRTDIDTDWRVIQEALALFINDKANEIGTGLAFPSQSLYVETLPQDLLDRLGAKAEASQS